MSLSVMAAPDPHAITNSLMFMLPTTLYAVHILLDSPDFGSLFHQLTSANHTAPSKLLFTITFGSTLKLILIHLILAHFISAAFAPVVISNSNRQTFHCTAKARLFITLYNCMYVCIYGLLAHVALRPSVVIYCKVLHYITIYKEK